jgi:hypothetical protein
MESHGKSKQVLYNKLFGSLSIAIVAVAQFCSTPWSLGDPQALNYLGSSMSVFHGYNI